MWSPTHVQVTVQKSRDLLTKGKNGTNDVFVTIALGKEKYQTSVKEKASGAVEWHEECELQIPEHGNTAEVVLTALHRNFLGVDEFLGMVNIPLAEFDVYERPRNRWYTLKSKPGKEKTKPRGELEVKIAFIVKAGSLTDLSKKEKHKSSLGQLSHMAQSVGGSLLSIGSSDKRKSLKKIAKSIGHKVTRKDKKSGSFKEENFEGSSGTLEGTPVRARSGQLPGEADPGVISEGESEDEFTFDDLSHKSSASSLSTTQPPPTNTTTSVSTTSTVPAANSLENLAGGEFLRRTSATPIVKPPAKPPRTTPLPDKAVDEWEEKLFGKQGKDTLSVGGDTLKRRSWEGSRNILSSQPEVEEPQEISPIIETAEQPNLAPADPIPVRNNKDASLESEKIEEKEKEKEQNKFARKLKTLRRDAKFSELFPDTKPAVSSLVSASTPYERIIIGGESDGNNQRNKSSRLPQEVMQKFEEKSREELIEMVCELQGAVEHQQRRMKDMEDYLDNLLLRVMETTPRLLQNPYVTHKSISSSG